MALAETSFEGAELRSALREILLIEEESASLGNEIALLEQNFERIRFEAGERETAFRHATMDLGLERQRRFGHGAHAEIADLDYQIGELQKRLAESLADKQQRTQELAGEVALLRSERESREHDAAERYHALDAMIGRARGKVTGAELDPLFAELDDVRRRLSRARASLPPL